MSFFVVTEPAESRQLLTIEEMRKLAGLADGDDSQDDDLESRGLAIADDICAECNVRIGTGADPTLLQETISETFEALNLTSLRLSRRHEVEVVSAIIDGVAVESSTFRVDPEAGIVTRRIGSDCCTWRGDEVVIVYKAGFEEVPAALKQEASDRFASITTEAARDPYVKGETVEIPNVETRRVDYWAGSLPGSGSSAASASPNLRRFRNMAVA